MSYDFKSPIFKFLINKSKHSLFDLPEIGQVKVIPPIREDCVVTTLLSSNLKLNTFNVWQGIAFIFLIEPSDKIGKGLFKGQSEWSFINHGKALGGLHLYRMHKVYLRIFRHNSGNLTCWR